MDWIITPQLTRWSDAPAALLFDGIGSAGACFGILSTSGLWAFGLGLARRGVELCRPGSDFLRRSPIRVASRLSRKPGHVPGAVGGHSRADGEQKTRTFLVVRNDRIVCEWYAPGVTPATRQGTASLAKALVGGMSLARR